MHKPTAFFAISQTKNEKNCDFLQKSLLLWMASMGYFFNNPADSVVPFDIQN
jgi:hypothetical protein